MTDKAKASEHDLRGIIGKNLVRLRKNVGLRQGEIARSIGVSRQTYSAWENGKSCPTSDCLIALSRKLRCTIDDLLDADPSGKELKFLSFHCEMEGNL